MIKVHDRVILDLAGGTGAWSKPYKEQGYTVYNITLPEYDILETDFLQNSFCFHHESNKHKTIYIAYKDIYGILAAPPCTMFSFYIRLQTHMDQIQMPGNPKTNLI